MKELSRKEAIQYVFSHKKGTLDELTNAIGSGNVKALSITGLIKRGQENSTKNSWAVTSEINSIFKSLETDKKENIFTKIQAILNHIFIDKSINTSSL